MAIAGAVALAVRVARRGGGLAIPVWALGGIMIAVSGGPYWAFHSIDRYLAWSAPAWLALFSGGIGRAAWTVVVPVTLGLALVLRARYLDIARLAGN